MVSKNQIKLIQSLHQKKFRKQHNLFIAEGLKVISELLNSKFRLYGIYATELIPEFSEHSPIIISPAELRKISALTTPNNCLAVFELPVPEPIKMGGLTVALDEIRDPGNLGTIIRLCDWFGIRQVICSEGTVDIYSPKVVQATMGSLCRVDVNYVTLEEFLDQPSVPVFGTFMDGDNIYQTSLPDSAFIIFGNEGNGISKKVAAFISHRISIPRFGNVRKTESLNVASATAIVLSEFSRRVSGT